MLDAMIRNRGCRTDKASWLPVTNQTIQLKPNAMRFEPTMTIAEKRQSSLNPHMRSRYRAARKNEMADEMSWRASV